MAGAPVTAKHFNQVAVRLAGQSVPPGVGCAAASRPQERQGVRGSGRHDPLRHDVCHCPGLGAEDGLGAQCAGGRRLHDPLEGRGLRVHRTDVRGQGRRPCGRAWRGPTRPATRGLPPRLHPARPSHRRLKVSRRGGPRDRSCSGRTRVAGDSERTKTPSLATFDPRQRSGVAPWPRW